MIAISGTIKLPEKFDNFSVEIPKIKTHGDLSTNAPMIFAKEILCKSAVLLRTACKQDIYIYKY